MEAWILAHKYQLIVAWLTTQKFLTGIQDTLDAMPKDLPPLRKIVFFMQKFGGYMGLGNRAIPLQGGQK